MCDDFPAIEIEIIAFAGSNNLSLFLVTNYFEYKRLLVTTCILFSGPICRDYWFSKIQHAY